MAAKRVAGGESVNLVAGLHGACFPNLFEIHNLKFRNILKKIWIVYNHVTYVCVKNQYEICCILSCVKIDKFPDLESEQ
jgi:hypothetical protein